MKVRVLKEMPFAKVGDIIEQEKYPNVKNPCFSFPYNNDEMLFSPKEVKKWIKDGWLEKVKEESLLELFMKEYNKNHSIPMPIDAFIQNLAQIAKEHYLEVFDKALNGMDSEDILREGLFKIIRKALEDC